MTAELSFSAQPPAGSRIGDLSSVSVLIVDDTPSKRMALKSVLLPLGVKIVEADSGTAALRCVMAEDFAVILLDVKMPIMDGYETARFIRQRRESEMTPIIFVTAYSAEDLDRYAEGAVDFMSVPVIPAELRAKVAVFSNLFVTANGLAVEARELQASANQLSVVADGAPIGIFQTDAENRYVYTNPRWTQIAGISAEQAHGQPWDSIMAPEQRPGPPAKISDDGLGPAELSHRFDVVDPGAEARIALITSRSIVDADGAPAGWVGTLADVTAEVAVEAVLSDARDRATEASRLKSDFLANMSHEIRTPMNGVIGMTELLLDTELDPRQRDYAQTVRNSGEALLTIINDILDFSKVEAGKLEVEDIDFDPRAVIDDVVDLLAGAAQFKELELIAVVKDDVPATVSGDPGRVRQVLTNLLGNAIKFTEAGEIKILATMEETDGSASVIRIAVSDTGDGIAEDQLAAIFQPFVQADTSTSRKYGGTGLGLAISGQLVALMGGTSGVSSDLGSGSTFWFTISVGTDAAQGKQDSPPPDPELAGTTILVVDDNTSQRDVLADYLSDWGMAVSTSDTGPAALETMRSATSEDRPFAVVLVDLYMPGMDGLELIAAIEADPVLSPQVVLMTRLAPGLDRGSDVPQQSGVCTSLSKPVHRHELLACLHLALGLRVADEAPKRPTDQRSPPPGGLERGRLLLAEDNQINQKVAVAMLSGAGYRVDTVADGAAAVTAAAAHAYDVILMDCQMPKLSGYEATTAIRAREGSGPRVPIIAMTAGARREDRELCLAHGMDGYLAKPFSRDTLLAMVGRSNAIEPYRFTGSNGNGSHGAPPIDDESSPGEGEAASTGRVRVTAELAEREDSFETSVGALIDPFVLLRPLRDPDGEIVDFAYDYANEAACESNGRGREELLGLRMVDRVSQLAPVGLFAAYAEVFETGEALALDNYTQPSRRGGEAGRRSFDVRAVKAGELVGLTWREVTGRDRADAERARLAAIVRSSDDAIVSLAVDLSVTTWNHGAEQIYGYTAEEMLGRSSEVLIPDGATVESRGLREKSVAGGTVHRYQTQRLHKDGTLVDVEITEFVQLDSAGAAAGATTIARDITEQTRARHALAESEARYGEILDATPDGVWRVDAGQRTNYVNTRMADMLGYTPEEMIGRPLAEFMDPEWQHVAQRELELSHDERRAGLLEHCFLRKDGTQCWTRVSHRPLRTEDDQHFGWLAIISDISASKAQTLELRSTEGFLEAMADSIAEGVCAMDREGCVTYMNHAAETLLGWNNDELRGRSMHDTIHYQHDDGAPRPDTDCPMTDVLSTATVIRVESDTFTRRDGELLPVAYSASPILVEESVHGVVIVFADGSTSKAAVQRRQRELENLNWVGRIRDALDEDRFVLYAQMIIDVHSREMVMHELLLRMVDRDGTIVAPGRFLPAAEQYGLIEDIDRWVLGEAVKLAARGLKVHFNLSGRTLGSRELINDLVRALRQTGADPTLLVCEITETALASDEDVAQAYVRELSELGCQIALDDFGVGYGGFAYLKRLPVSVIKIDLQFVRDLETSPQNQHVVKAIVNLAQGFGRQTVAEGVEDPATLELLEQYGVDYAQGFGIGLPAPLDSLLLGHRASAADARP